MGDEGARALTRDRASRLGGLVAFSFLLPIGLWGVVQAVRRDRTWIAGALGFVAGCVFSIATTLRGYTVMGGGHYDIDPQMDATSASTSIASWSRWSGATSGGRNRSTLP